MPIRPSGVTNRTNAAATSHQFTATVHGTRCSARATLLPSANHVTHCSAASVANGTDSAICASWASRGVGRTTPLDDLRRLLELVEEAGQRPQPRMVVQVGDGDLRVAVPQRGDQLRRGQRAAAEGEEVGLRARRRRRRADPATAPASQLAVPPRSEACSAVAARRRPGQRVAVDLAGRAGGQLVDPDQARHQRGGQLLGEQRPRGGHVEVRVGAGDVADQHRRARRRPPNRGGAAADARQVHQRRVDFAQFDAATADLDLIVGAAAEDQAFAFQPHQVAAAVGAPPAQRRHRRVLLGVLGLVEVAGQPHAADHQLTDLAVGHRLAVPVDDGQVPARQRADRCAPGSSPSSRAAHATTVASVGP